MSLLGMLGLNNTSTSTNSINVTAAAYMSVTNDAIHQAAQSATCDNTIKICDVTAGGDIDISDVTQQCTVKVSGVNSFQDMLKNDATTNIASAMSAAAQAAASGLPSGDQASSNNTLSSSVTSAMALKNHIVTTCQQTVKEKNDMSICGLHAGKTVAISKLLQSSAADLIQSCTASATSSNTALQTLTQTASAMASSKATGFDPLELFKDLLAMGPWVIIALVVGVLGLGFITWLFFKTTADTASSSVGSAAPMIMSGIIMLIGGCLGYLGLALMNEWWPWAGKTAVPGTDSSDPTDLRLVYGPKLDTFAATCKNTETKTGITSLSGAIAAFNTANADLSYAGFFYDRASATMYLVKTDQVAYDSSGGCAARTGDGDTIGLDTFCMCGNFLMRFTAQNPTLDGSGNPTGTVPDANDFQTQNPNLVPSLQYACGMPFSVDASSCRAAIAGQRCPTPGPSTTDVKGNPLCDASGFMLTYATCPSGSCGGAGQPACPYAGCTGKSDTWGLPVDQSGNVVQWSAFPAASMKMVRTPEGTRCPTSWKPRVTAVGGCIGDAETWSTVIGVTSTQAVAKGKKATTITQWILIGLGIMFALGGITTMIVRMGAKPIARQGDATNESGVELASVST